MKSITTLVAVIGVAVAAAATQAGAQSSVPGRPAHPGALTAATPPPPPPTRPDGLASATRPTVGAGPYGNGTYTNLWPSPAPTLVDDLAVPRQPPRRPRAGVGTVAAKPHVRHNELFGPCNNSDCNEASYVTDCGVVGGGMSSEPGGAISCNSGPQHDPK